MGSKDKGDLRSGVTLEVSSGGANSSLNSTEQRFLPPDLHNNDTNWIVDNSLSGDDFKEVLKLSSSRIACFYFRDKLSLKASGREAIQYLKETPSSCIWANLAFRKAFQIDSEQELLKTQFVNFFPNKEFTEKFINQFAENNLQLQNFDCEHTTPDGQRIVHLASLYPISDNLNFQKIWVVFRDVIDSPLAVQRLQKAEEHYRTLVERPGLILVRLRSDGEYLYISPNIKDLIGKEPEDLKSDPFLLRSFIHPDDLLSHESIYRARKQKKPDTIEIEYRVRCVDGEYRWFREKQTPKFNDKGEIEYFDSITISIQEKKVLEKELLQAERMKTIGSLTAAIAHEFNNHLTAVIGELGLSFEHIKSSDIAFESLSNAEKAALSCSDLARQLLRFSQGTQAPAAILNLSTLVRETNELLPHLLPASIKRKIEIEQQDLLITGHASFIQQALVSLALRSGAAMRGSGELGITVRNLEIADASGSIPYRQVKPGQYVEVTITDNGESIPTKQLAQIFKPLAGKSNKFGGLALVFSVIESHGGQVHIKSREGSGTTVKFILPSAKDPEQPTIDRQGIDYGRGKEYILIAEDDDLVLSMVRTALSLKGYKVLTAQDGEIALSKFNENQDKISLALIDYTMPRLSGRDLACEIRKTHPGLPVIFTSGYNQEASSEDQAMLSQSSSTSFLGKPFSIPSLLAQVREMIDEKEK